MNIANCQATLIKTFRQAGDPVRKKGQEDYFKDVLSFYGIKTPVLKSLFNSWYKTEFKGKDLKTHIALSQAFFSSRFGEEKYTAIMLLTKCLKHLTRAHVPVLAKIIDKHVFDWASCDGLAGKVLCEMIKLDTGIARAIYPWRLAKNPWRKRACSVAFVKIARHGRYNELIYNIVTDCVKCPDRFVQLGVGWVLRELSIADKNLVVHFIKTNYEKFSREGLRYAIEKMGPNVRQAILKSTF